MTAVLRVFVSSVQKELEDERLIVQNLVSTDSFLSAHCTPVLYEFEPASPTGALEGCLQALDACQVYLLIVGMQYGAPVGDLSITHAEYRRAKARGLPVLAFIRGERHATRVNLRLLVAEGKGRAVRYLPPIHDPAENRPTSPESRPMESTDNRPTTPRNRPTGSSPIGRQGDRARRKPHNGRGAG